MAEYAPERCFDINKDRIFKRNGNIDKALHEAMQFMLLVSFFHKCFISVAVELKALLILPLIDRIFGV